MTYAIMGAAVANVARQQQLALEEEQMATYSQDDLDNDWEFKIVRSTGHAFSKPEVLNQLLQEEARAGWVMIEKFDDARIRFKRQCRTSAHVAPLSGEIDPYRSYYGTSPNKYLWFLVLELIVALGLILFGLAMAWSIR